MKYLTIILFFGCNCFLSALSEESASDTESLEYEEENYDLSLEEINKDLQQKTSVRFQILELLQENDAKSIYLPIKKYIYDILSKPVLCIGTGKNKNYISQFALPTYIQIYDISIDQNTRIDPHLLGDAFDNNFILHKEFNIVLFAHVGSGNLTINKSTTLTFTKYYNCLFDDGLFIYSSAVLDTKESFANYEIHWKKLLSSIGFKNIICFIKDESLRYDYPQAYAFVVIANK